MDHLILILLSASIVSSVAKSVPFRSSYGVTQPVVKNHHDTGQTTTSIGNSSEELTQYLQIAVTKNVFYYTPLRADKKLKVLRDHSYLAYHQDPIGQEDILLRVDPKFSPFPGKTKYIRLQRNKLGHKHREDYDLRRPAYFVYDVISSIYRDLEDSEVPYTRVTLIQENFGVRMKRSKLSDRIRDAIGRAKDKKVIHVPALFIEPDQDGFQNIFYEEMMNSALCLTSQPELNRHELVDEYEVLLCNKKGYGKLLNPTTTTTPPPPRSKRQEPTSPGRERDNDQQYKDHGTEDSKWHMNKTNHDTLWKADKTGTSTPLPSEGDEESDSDSISADYDYEGEGDTGNGTAGWENDDIVEDPSHLDYMTWPPFLPNGVKDDDEVRRTLHSHQENFTLDYIRVNLLLNQEEFQFEKRLFALNDSTHLTNYYEYFLKLSPYKMKPLLLNFFANREGTLTKFQKNALTLTTLRQLLILFTIEVHHVNCFNRHLRFYGYMMKKPASINGDEITNDARLARGIIMRGLELIRHVPQYNFHRNHLLRFLIGALKERASLSKSLTTVVGENDYTELYEVASYLEHMLKNGIHPDELNQDLFVQETRFYSHHFMNTLTL